MDPFSLDHIFHICTLTAFRQAAVARASHAQAHAWHALAFRLSGAKTVTVLGDIRGQTTPLRSSFPRVVKEHCHTACGVMYSPAFSGGYRRPRNSRLLRPPIRVAATHHDVPRFVWRYGDLNPRPMACKATALATELYPQARFPARERSLLARSTCVPVRRVRRIYRKGRRV